jgi:hypothetical protein
MPFYLATPRRNAFAKQKSRVTARTEYQRTAPSTLFLQVFTVTSWVLSSLRDLLHHVSLAAAAFVLSGNGAPVIIKSSVTPVPSFFQTIPLSLTIDVNVPGLFLSFVDTLTDDEVDVLNGLGFYFIEAASGISGYAKLHPDDDDLKFAVGLKDLSTVDRPPQGYLRYDQVQVFVQIKSVITRAAQCLSLAFGLEKPGVRMVGYGSWQKISARVLMPDKTFLVEKKRKKKPDDHDEDAEYELAASAEADHSISCDREVPVIDGPPEDAPTDLHGIFLPYEPNYSAPDRQALNVFATYFMSIMINNADFAEEILDRLNSTWIASICTTAEGQHLAHMMASLVIAYKACVGVYFIITDFMYEGAVLYSPRPFQLKQFKLPAVSTLTGEALRKELRDYSFRTLTLGGVLILAGLIEAQDQMEDDDAFTARLREECAKYPSLRKLQRAVHQLVTVSDGAKRDSIMKELGKVPFPQRPVSVHATSVIRALDLMNPASSELPNADDFLSVEHFFSTDKTVLALSMFGGSAPSPLASGKGYSVTGREGKNLVAKCPNPLTFKVKDTVTAAKDWDAFFRSGTHVQGQSGAHGRKSERSIKGEHATRVWSEMSAVVAQVQATERSKAPGARTLKNEGKKRKDRDDDQGEDQGRSAKRAPAMQIFF